MTEPLLPMNQATSRQKEIEKQEAYEKLMTPFTKGAMFLCIIALIGFLYVDANRFSHHSVPFSKDFPFHMVEYILILVAISGVRGRRDHPLFLRALKYTGIIFTLFSLSKVLSVFYFETIEAASQCFGLTVEGMIFLLIKRIFILIIIMTMTIVVAFLESSQKTIDIKKETSERIGLTYGLLNAHNLTVSPEEKLSRVVNQV
jgi:hypothetical protein